MSTVHELCFGDRFQAVIDSGIIAPLVYLMQNAEFDIKKEAAWAISNATSGGSYEHIQYGPMPFNMLFFDLFISNSITFQLCLLLHLVVTWKWVLIMLQYRSSVLYHLPINFSL